MADIQGGWGRELLTGTDAADNIRGGAGNDTIEGGPGDDILTGDAGNDVLSGGDGNDVLYDAGKRGTFYGGSGDDYLDWHSRSGGVALLDGGVGNDFIYVSADTGASSDITVFGGEGDDHITISAFGAARRILVDAGNGDDVVRVAAGTDADVTLGPGADTLILTGGRSSYGGYPVPTVIEDYRPGIDVLHLGFKDGSVVWSDWSGSDNPFGSGYVRLQQRGADTVLQIDADGNGGTCGFADVLVFRNVEVSAFSASDFDGFSPDGSAPVGEVLVAELVGSVIDGTVGPDRIDGMGGDDVLIGFAGDDTLDGGDGNDLIEGGPGNDLLIGGNGHDALFDFGGSDTLLGGDGGDILGWGGGDMQTAFLDAGEGDDYLSIWTQDYLAVAAASARGGAGDDHAYLFCSPQLTIDVDLGEGNDDISIFGYGSATVTLGAGADRITTPGSPGLGYWPRTGVITITDYVPGEDILDVRFGDVNWQDWLWSGEGNPFGSGFARVVQQGADSVLQIDADGELGWRNYASVVTLRNVLTTDLSAADFNGYSPDGSMPVGLVIQGTGGTDALVGTVSPDKIVGGVGDDSIEGRGGDDTLEGGDGNDFIQGGFGNDLITGGDGDDLLYDAAGSGTLLGGGGDDRLSFYGYHADALMLDGGAGNDSLLVYLPNASVPCVTMLGGDGDDTLSFGGFGAAENVELDAGDGNDVVSVQGISSAIVTLGSGADRMLLGWGWTNELRNVLVRDFHSGEDVLELSFEEIGGWSGSTNPFYDGFASLAQDGADSLLQIATSGTGFQSRSMAPVPTAPPDFHGIGSLLEFMSRMPQPVVYETAHTALRFSNVEAAEFSAADFGGFAPNAGRYFEAVYGGGNADVLTGTAADNRLVGRGGGDTLTGGAGADEFVFNTPPGTGTNRDIVTDFSHGEDKVVLDCLVFDMLVAGNLAAENFSSNSTGTARDADDYVLYNSVTGELSYDADGSGAGTSVAIALLASLPSLAAADFMVV